MIGFVNGTFDLALELRRREVGQSELAKLAGVSRPTVARLAAGQSPGRPRTRRLLRTALAEFPVIEEIIPPAPPPTEPVHIGPPEGSAATGRPTGRQLLEELQRQPKPAWMQRGDA